MPPVPVPTPINYIKNCGCIGVANDDKKCSVGNLLL